MSDTVTDENALSLRDAACAKLVKSVTAQTEDTHDAAEIETFITKLFDTYFTASQKKGEAPDKAAVKISKIIAKQAIKKFPAPQPEEDPAPTEAAQPEASGGQVTGKIAGIDKKMLKILNAVSEHYGEPITIASGLRSKSAQAQAMYANWFSHLRNGKDNPCLAKNEKLRMQLDKLKQEKKKAEFVDTLAKKADWKILTRHTTGDEVDLPGNSDPRIIAALATCLNHRSGRNSEGARVHHFDNSKAVWPIIDSTKARWDN